MATLITNVRVWDGSGAEPYAADVLLEGDRIAAVGAGLAAPRAWPRRGPTSSTAAAAC